MRSLQRGCGGRQGWRRLLIMIGGKVVLKRKMMIRREAGRIGRERGVGMCVD